MYITYPYEGLNSRSIVLYCVEREAQGTHMVLYFMYSEVVGFIFLQNNHKHLSFFVYFILFFYTKFYYMGKVFYA